jgi:hypothetical protein
MKITVTDLEDSARTSEIMARFGDPITEATARTVIKVGLRDTACRAVGCMGWNWRQWLLGSLKQDISARVEPFVERSLQMREMTSSYVGVPLHDLYLLHCAIFGSTKEQLRKVAERIADASGDKGAKPVDESELYAAAWSGMMKYWILGEQEKAIEQAEQIWGSYHDPANRGAAKTLVNPWLKRDWDAFTKKQQEDFEKRWKGARQFSKRSEDGSNIVVSARLRPFEQLWCWAHVGMALLAYRFHGAEVATDPFWFPSHALKCVERNS